MRRLPRFLQAQQTKRIPGRKSRVGGASVLLWCLEAFFWLSGFRRKTNSSWSPRRAVVIKLDRLGDIVLCSGFLADLRQAWPACRITLLVRESLVELARCCPDVDEVLGVPESVGFEQFSQRGLRGARHVLKWASFCMRRGLWARRFDAAIIPRWEPDYYGAVPLAFCTGAAQRWGVTENATPYKAALNSGFDGLLTHVICGKADEHEVRLDHQIARAMGIPSPHGARLVPWFDERALSEARRLLMDAGLDFGKKIVVLCMGAGRPHKIWPVERYASLCREVFDPAEVCLLTIGAESERPLGLRLRELVRDGVVNAEGRIPLRLLPATVSLGSLYIGSDTGPMHLAAAAGVPVFEISCHPLNGDPLLAESPRRFGPWGVPFAITQPDRAMPPCSTHCQADQPHCILNVSTAQAVATLRSLLGALNKHSTRKTKLRWFS